MDRVLRNSKKSSILACGNTHESVSMKALFEFDNLFSLTSYFTTEKVCKEFLAQQRWGGDVVCPICGKHHCKQRFDGRYRCDRCKHNFSVISSTIFENTKVSLRKWFIAMYLISSHKKGVSSHQLSRDIDVSQKTAWYMLQKIRTLYKQDDATALSGIVECDEVYIGGKEKWKHKSMRTPRTQGRSTKTKTPVFGMMERSYIIDRNGNEVPMSYVRAIIVSKTDKTTLQPIIGQFVEEGSHVITDELSAYKGLEQLGYRHSVVAHGAEEYANGDVFTNGIEGFWCHFRRMIDGCYHNVSDEHLQAYIDEACYRWNTRKASQSERFCDMFNKSIGLVVKHYELKLCGMVG